MMFIHGDDELKEKMRIIEKCSLIPYREIEKEYDKVCRLLITTTCILYIQFLEE
jgi:hypothetical protein